MDAAVRPAATAQKLSVSPEEDRAVGRSEQVLSHATTGVPSPPVTPDR